MSNKKTYCKQQTQIKSLLSYYRDQAFYGATGQLHFGKTRLRQTLDIL